MAGVTVGVFSLCLWGFQREIARRQGYAPLLPGETIAAIPSAPSASAVDREVERWKAQAQQKPEDDGAWANLGDALMQKARETADASYYTHADRAYDRALALNAKNGAAVSGKAWVFGARHEFEKSIEWANRAISLDPKNAAAYGLLGDAALEMGNYEEAFTHYQKMMDTRPDIASYSRGAHLLFVTGDYRKAVWLMLKAIQAGGPYAENTAWCRAQMAQMFLSNGNLLAAENTLKAALKQTPDNYHLLAAMGRLRAAQKAFPEAVEYYRKAAAIAPQLETVIALGELYELTGQNAEAQKQFATVEAIHRMNKANGIQGDMLLARFYADRDRNLPEALRMAEEEYKTRKNVLAADTLAWCYYKNGRLREAAEMIERAMSQKTPDARILFHAGMIRYKLGETSAAQRYLYRALSLNPAFSPKDAPTAAALLQQLGKTGSGVKTANTLQPENAPMSGAMMR
jgi:tetratricopeptide (TPR) repeat protein